MFARLGTTLKRPATSTSEDPDSEDEQSSPLEYAGVLKSDAAIKAKEKKTLIEKKKKALLLRKKQLEAIKKQSLEQRLGKTHSYEWIVKNIINEKINNMQTSRQDSC